MTGPVSHQLVLSTTLLHQDIGRAPTVTGAKYPTNIYHPGKAIIAGDHGSSDKTGDNTLSSFAVADTLGFLDERVLLTLGVRSQRVRQKMSNPSYDERKLTPAVGIVLKPWEAPVSLYANYIEGLTQGGMVTDQKAANYGEQFAPYVAKQMEAGVKWDLGDFTHTLAVFQIDKPSMIYDKPSNRYNDDGEQRNRGVEWTMFGEIVPSVRLLGGVTYTRAVLSKTANGAMDGNTARGVPAWSANLGAEWDLPGVEGLTLTALGIHSSSQYLDSANQLKIPQWTRYDLGARYATKVLSKDVTLRASLRTSRTAPTGPVCSTMVMRLSANRARSNSPPASTSEVNMQRLKRLGGACLLAMLYSNLTLAGAYADLEVGKPVAGQVGAAHPPAWQVALKAGDLVRGRLDGDVSLRLLDAEGRPLRLLIDGLDQPREFLFVAAQDGRYAVRAEPWRYARRRVSA